MNDTDQLELLRARIKELEEENREKVQLLGIIAHDLRNPLSAIRSAAEVLMLTLSSEPRVQRAHGVFERQTAQMTRQIDRLSDIARISRGTLALERAIVDLTQISRRALDENSERLTSAHLTLESDLPKDAIWIDADQVRLSEIFESLFTNAIKVSHPNGRIRVTLETSGSSALLRFASDGDRIEPSLGLLLVKGLIELHGGTMTTTCHDGGGAVFELRVPLAA